MGKKDRKKGKGAEKTALRTEKKALNKIKRDLAAKGEDDIEKLIARFQEEERKKPVVGEEPCPQPSPRSGFSLCPHPDKDELILFGGEYYNGSKTEMFNDLFFYNLKKGQWSILHCKEKPPPRCSHQAIVVSQRGGQMWVFGGEFASPTRSNFYHYKDLWVFHFAEKRWEQIKAHGGPSSRSGHRMVVSRKQIVVFGGFHEVLGDYKYFNDVYLFSLESYTWTKIEPVGKAPCPRSGCLMAPLIDGRILVYGGYNKEKVKKDVDKGIPHTDMYYLHVDERTEPHKWKWIQVKPSGIPPSPRSGMSIAVASNNQAYAFGGVRDKETDEENLVGVFQNDLHLLELENGRFLPISLHGKATSGPKKRRRKAKEDGGMDKEDCEEVADTLENTKITDGNTVVSTCDDGIFTVKIGPSTSSTVPFGMLDESSSMTSQSECFVPPPRMNTSMAVKSGILYMYGGVYEDGDRQFTLSDFYALDFHKLDEWRTIVPFSTTKLEWIESEESESDDSEGGDIADGDDDDDDDEEEEEARSEDEEMDTQ